MMLLSDQRERRRHGHAADDHRRASPGRDRGRETFVVHYASGRALTAADEGSNVTVLGSDLARKYGKARR